MDRSDTEYAPYYCEENVWRFLRRHEPEAAEGWAVFVLGPGGAVALFDQAAGRPGDGLVLWDYHVVALIAFADGTRIVDLDSASSAVAPASEWLRRSFGRPGPARAEVVAYPPRFRVLPGREFVRRFSSDRSHMRRADGSWMAPPPPWPCPCGGCQGLAERGCGEPEAPWSLPLLLDPGAEAPGRLMDLAGFSRLLR